MAVGPLRWLAARGVQVERVLSDNGKCYHSKAFRACCQEQNVNQRFTKPYTPRTNGQAERFIPSV